MYIWWSREVYSIAQKKIERYRYALSALHSLHALSAFSTNIVQSKTYGYNGIAFNKCEYSWHPLFLKQWTHCAMRAGTGCYWGGGRGSTHKWHIIAKCCHQWIDCLSGRRWSSMPIFGPVQHVLWSNRCYIYCHFSTLMVLACRKFDWTSVWDYMWKYFTTLFFLWVSKIYTYNAKNTILHKKWTFTVLEYYVWYVNKYDFMKYF